LRLKQGASQGSHLGVLKHDEIIGNDYGAVLWTHKGKPFYVLKPTAGEFMRRVRRQTQIVFPKDAGFLLMNLDIFPGARVVECGSGSGALTSVLAHFVGPEGHVYTYEKRENFSELARSNCERWGVEGRITFRRQDLAEGFAERDMDAVFLDVPNPHDFLTTAWEALAPGRRLGILVPTFNQIQSVLEGMREVPFADVQVVEVLQRSLKTNPRRVRPDDMMIGHTGFLIIGSKVMELAGDVPPGEESLSEKAAPEEGDAGHGEDQA
jgi:tRNA (adenine57-N1/adenine58-N1)-methyltransferase